jgi:cytochrome P450
LQQQRLDHALLRQRQSRRRCLSRIPTRFNIDRAPNRQLAFGNGAHVCIGQHLARMEMRILFEELLPRLKSVSSTASHATAKASSSTA